MRSPLMAALTTIACVSVVIPSRIRAQVPDRSALGFEVASIRPAPPQVDRRTSTRMSVQINGKDQTGNLNYTNTNLREILGQAYRVQQYQIAGGPDWLDSQRFDIAAVIPAGATRDQVPFMLQNLLLDRFKIALHRETKDLPVYALIVGKDGSNLKRVETATGISSNSNRTRWQVSAKTSMLRLAEFLAPLLDRPVLDATGLEGAFDIVLEWTPDTAEQAGTGPSLFTAVQEQLGLKLEARRGPVEILVIDHAEEPGEN